MRKSGSMWRRLGPQEQRILKHLALHPRQNMQQIQLALGLENKNYPTVRHAISALNRLELVKGEPAVSEKNVQIKVWLLTSEGLLFVLRDRAKEMSKEELNLIFDNYVPDKEQRDFMKMVHAELGTSLTAKFITGFLAVTVLDKNAGSDLIETIASVSLARMMKGLSKEEMDRVGKLIERFMSTRMGVKGKVLLKAFKAVGML